MQNYEKIKEDFDKYAEKYEMTINMDSGVHRNILFKMPDTREGFFYLTTWPDYLCISGDYGTYVFERAHDMFNFFGTGSINPGYWAEKLEGVDRCDGYKKFDFDAFCKCVDEYIEDYWEYESDEEKIGVKEDVDFHIKSEDIKSIDVAAQKIWDYKSPHGHTFENFGECFGGGGTEDYTYRYIWCLFAIVYGIKRYRESKEQQV
jgi:hypothetical protein